MAILCAACADKPPEAPAVVDHAQVSFARGTYQAKPWPIYTGSDDATEISLYLRTRVKRDFDLNAQRVNDCDAMLSSATVAAAAKVSK